jgi:hypothetical protein
MFTVAALLTRTESQKKGAGQDLQPEKSYMPHLNTSCDCLELIYGVATGEEPALRINKVFSNTSGHPVQQLMPGIPRLPFRFYEEMPGSAFTF